MKSTTPKSGRNEAPPRLPDGWYQSSGPMSGPGTRRWTNRQPKDDQPICSFVWELPGGQLHWEVLARAPRLGGHTVCSIAGGTASDLTLALALVNQAEQHARKRLARKE